MTKIPTPLYYDILAFKLEPQGRSGRPKKPRLAKFFAEQINPRELYKQIINLQGGRDNEGIKAFLKSVNFTMPGLNGPPVIATVDDINKFKSDLTSWLKTIRQRKDPRHLTGKFSMLSFDETQLKDINQYLSNCHPFLLVNFVTSHKPNVLEKFDEKTVGGMADFANPKIQKFNPMRTGGIFYQLAMQCPDSMSACVYGFFADILEGEPVKLCSCGRVFLAKDARQRFCGEINCNRRRGRQATRISRNLKRLSS